MRRTDALAIGTFRRLRSAIGTAGRAGTAASRAHFILSELAVVVLVELPQRRCRIADFVGGQNAIVVRIQRGDQRRTDPLAISTGPLRTRFIIGRPLRTPFGAVASTRAIAAGAFGLFLGETGPGGERDDQTHYELHFIFHGVFFSVERVFELPTAPRGARNSAAKARVRF
jgi:hypothetical protein